MIIKGNKIACADEQCGYVTDKKPGKRGITINGVQLLDKTRKINKLLHNNNSSKVVFNDICRKLIKF